MKRLAKRPFTFEKQKYLFTIDTDDLKLLLRCYLGSSEKAETVKLTKYSPLWKRILTIVAEEYSSKLHNNLIGSPDRLTADVRQDFDIPYPASTKFISFKDALQSDGIVRLDLKAKIEAFSDYLEYLQITFIRVEFENQHVFISTEEQVKFFDEMLQQSVKRKQEEIKEIQKVQDALFYFNRR